MAHAISQLETAAGRFLSGLPSASAIVSPVDGSTPADIMAPMSHLVALASLTEVYHILGDVDQGRGLEGRLACADRLALLAQRYTQLDLNPCSGVSGPQILILTILALTSRHAVEPMVHRCRAAGAAH